MPSALRPFRIDLLLLLVAGAWGSTYLTTKVLIIGDAVIALLASRMLLAGAIMGVFVALRRKRLTRSELLNGVFLGIVLAGVFACETFGIAGTSATNAGLIISLTMVFTPILESALSRRRLPTTFFFAAIVAVAGVALLTGNGAFKPLGLGDLLILAAALVRAVNVTFIHKLTSGKPIDSLHLTTVQLATCAVLFTGTSLFAGKPIPHYLAQLNLSSWLAFLYLVVMCTVCAFFIQTWAIRRTSPSRVSLLLGTEPLWAAAIGITIAHDSFAPIGYVGLLLVLVGTAWGRSVEQKHRSLRPNQPSARALTHADERSPH
ncbi:MAG: DMT family transporter [Lacisediminihabitans sp.]